LRQSVFGRLAGYEDVNDAERLSCDPAMRWVVGHQAIAGTAASASQMGRFETKWLSRPENLVALTDLPGQWIDKVHQQRPPKVIVLDMDSSESPTYGDREGSAYNGHFGCTCYTHCSCSTSSAMLSGALCDLVTSIALMVGV
jgi:Transposase DDE domain group 1